MCVCVSSLLVDVNEVCLRFDSFFTRWSQHPGEMSCVHVKAQLVDVVLTRRLAFSWHCAPLEPFAVQEKAVRRTHEARKRAEKKCYECCSVRLGCFFLRSMCDLKGSAVTEGNAVIFNDPPRGARSQLISGFLKCWLQPLPRTIKATLL